MKLIVGLGNPGEQYEETRHNIGFKAVENIALKLNIQISKKKFKGLFIKQDGYILAKPLTFMNNSGEFVQAMMIFFKIGPKDLLIIHDELDFPVGKATIKEGGSSGGHNGIKSIIESIGTNDFKRLRIGIDKEKPVSDYVLRKFKQNEKDLLPEVLEGVSEAVLSFLYNDIRFVMNEFNKKKK